MTILCECYPVRVAELSWVVSISPKATRFSIHTENHCPVVAIVCHQYIAVPIYNNIGWAEKTFLS